MPKSNVRRFIDGQKENSDWEKKEIKSAREAKAEHILYELSNHECFYTNDISDAMSVLPYPKKDVLKVFSQYREEYNNANN